jgi:hypothetical protein
MVDLVVAGSTVAAGQVGLKKIGSDHVETIRDKLRRQQVEIERLGADGKVIRDPRTA